MHSNVIIELNAKIGRYTRNRISSFYFHKFIRKDKMEQNK